MKSLKKLYLLLGILSVALQTPFAGSALIVDQMAMPEEMTFSAAELYQPVKQPVLISAPSRQDLAIEISAFELEEEEDKHNSKLRKLYRHLFSVSAYIHGQLDPHLAGQKDELLVETSFYPKSDSLFTLYEVYRI